MNLSILKIVCLEFDRLKELYLHFLFQTITTLKLSSDSASSLLISVGTLFKIFDKFVCNRGSVSDQNPSLQRIKRSTFNVATFFIVSELWLFAPTFNLVEIKCRALA